MRSLLWLMLVSVLSAYVLAGDVVVEYNELRDVTEVFTETSELRVLQGNGKHEITIKHHLPHRAEPGEAPADVVIDIQVASHRPQYRSGLNPIKMIIKSGDDNVECGSFAYSVSYTPFPDRRVLESIGFRIGFAELVSLSKSDTWTLKLNDALLMAGPETTCSAVAFVEKFGVATGVPKPPPQAQPTSFEVTDGYVEPAFAVALAREALREVETKCRQALYDTEHYKLLVSDRKTESLKKQSQTQGKDRFWAIREYLLADAEQNNMEFRALNSDSEVQAARDRLADAQDQLEKARCEYWKNPTFAH